MIIRKKTIILISLVLLLVIVGIVNHQLTEQSLKKSSDEYKEYEEEIALQATEDDVMLHAPSEEPNLESDTDFEVIDSKSNEISAITKEVDATIEETISRQENRKKTNYFIEYRLSRDKLRANLIERLNEIINNEKTTEQIRTEAQKRIIDIGDLAESELYIEGLIRSKGFDDALVFLSKDSARVVVDTNDLTEQEVMKILDIVKEETSLHTSNIKIMEKY